MRISRQILKSLVEHQSQAKSAIDAIGPTRSRPQWKAHKFTTLIPFYNHHNDPDVESQMFFGDDTRIMAQRMRRKLMTRPRDTLWWNATISVKHGGKACMRQYCKRRMKHAFIHALRGNGMDRDGRMVEPSSYSGLKGTLKIVLTEKALTEPFTTLQGEADMLVYSLLRQNSTPPKNKRRP